MSDLALAGEEQRALPRVQAEARADFVEVWRDDGGEREAMFRVKGDGIRAKQRVATRGDHHRVHDERRTSAFTRTTFAEHADDGADNHTPSLPDARPRSDRFRCGGRESKFLAVPKWRGNKRLTFSADLLSTSRTNLEAANSRIVDTDLALESTRMARNSILVQAGSTMLVQANASSQSVLKLLQ